MAHTPRTLARRTDRGLVTVEFAMSCIFSCVVSCWILSVDYFTSRCS